MGGGGGEGKERHTPYTAVRAQIAGRVELSCPPGHTAVVASVYAQPW